MFSAKGAPSLLSLGQRPRIKYAFEQALKARLNNVGRRNQAQRPRRAARLTRAFSACRDFYFIPAALPQAKIEAAPSALRVVTDRPERRGYSNFSFGAVSGDHGLVL
jgi:hypothetical protein